MNPAIVLRSIASTNKTLLGLCLTPLTTECAIMRGADGSSLEVVSSGSMLKAEELGALCVRHQVRVKGCCCCLRYRRKKMGAHDYSIQYSWLSG